MDNNSCLICTEDYNRSTRKPIKCQYCDFTSCYTCCRTYLLDQVIVKCMSPECNKEWTRQYIRSILPLTFINKELKQHKEKMLFDQERALMPATQHIVERRAMVKPLKIEKEQLYKEYIEAKRKYFGILDRLNRLNYGVGHNTREAKQEPTHFVRACPSEECRGFLNQQWKCGLCENYSCAKCHVLLFSLYRFNLVMLEWLFSIIILNIYHC